MTLQKQILIVDDDPVNRAALRTILTPEYRVLETENGAQALGVLRERPDEIALILLDLVLPGMDGCAFLAQAKAEQALASIPVIVTTRQDSEAAEIAALSGGAADFVVKPYRPQVILHRIANIIRLRETSAMIRQVQYDRLTGLYSKEFFYQQVKQLLLLHPEQEYDIICSDIENFKLINDMFGRPHRRLPAAGRGGAVYRPGGRPGHLRPSTRTASPACSSVRRATPTRCSSGLAPRSTPFPTPKT